MMRRLMIPMVVMGCAVMAVGQVAAPGTRPAARGGGAGGAGVAAPDRLDLNAFLRPYIDAQTILVAHADVSGVNTEEIEKYLTELFDEAKVPADAGPRRDLIMARAASDGFLARFKQLGGRHLFLTLAQSDIYPNVSGPAVLIKMEPGGDAKAMGEMVKAMTGLASVVPLTSEVVFAGQEATLGRIQEMIKGAPGGGGQARPELSLQGSPDTAVEAAVAFSADQRRVMRELAPRMLESLGISMDTLTNDIQGVNVHISLPPEPRVTVVFRENPEKAEAGRQSASARAIGDAIERARDQLLSNRDIQFAHETPELRELFRQVVTPKRAIYLPGGTIAVGGWNEQIPPGQIPHQALQIDTGQIRGMAKLAIMPALVQSQQKAGRVNSMGNIKDLLVGCIVFANDNKGMLPESLEMLAGVTRRPVEQLMVNPADPQHRKYVYKRWVSELNKIKELAATPLIWEQTDEGQGVNVGFADGHVEFMRDRKIFEEMIKNTEAWAKTVEKKDLP